MQKEVVIIGGGISGLALALILQHNNISFLLLEKNDYLGGHARTVSVKHNNDKKFFVDTGFIVFNKQNYPHLTALFKLLNVEIQKSKMSFASCNNTNNNIFQYSSNLKSLFSEFKNLYNIKFYKMIFDIIKFNSYSKKNFENLPIKLTLGAYLRKLKLGDYFINYYLLPMGACIWSMPKDEILKFPAKNFLQFFYNHSLLSIFIKHQWYCVKQGSINYVNKIKNICEQFLILNCNIEQINRNLDNVEITFNNTTINTKKIVFACHSNTVLELLGNHKTPQEQQILSDIAYKNNINITHTCNTYMPTNKTVWSAWNYFNSNNDTVCLTYWANILQNINKKYPIFSTLNPSVNIPNNFILDKVELSHPQFNLKAIEAQEQLKLIQGQNNTYFAGAYTRYGFHEDGILSAVNIAKQMNLNIPWEKLIKHYGK
jgi:predicted NAD/FAD-binding protein